MVEVASEARPVAQAHEMGGGGAVCGEVLALADAEGRLPALDRFEGFVPGRRSLYRRVLVPASAGGRCVPVWLYACGVRGLGRARFVPEGVWRGAARGMGRR